MAEVNFVIPLYNESDVFATLAKRLQTVMDRSKHSITAILVDDGSHDDTAELIRELCEKDSRFSGVILSRNFGHQLALTAGLSHVDATDAAMIIDGDLQDPPELVDEFYEKYLEGYDVVYAIREKRKESPLKRMAYKYFYRLMRRISYAEIPLDSGDFSLISRRVVDRLNAMPEESRFIRGMRSWVGFKQIGITYERAERHAGDSKYSLKKLMGLAFDGIFNFSEYPIKVLTRIGLFAIVLSSLYLVYTIIMRFVFGNVESGFTALLSVIVLFGGIQLLALGLLGEYILRIFFQVKNRPLFIVKEVIKKDG
jgi:dolichol-phosphate mannosyltransferase